MNLEEITKIESQYCCLNGEPVLGDALNQLKARWEHGHCDRETSLRLLFLAWYSCAEPPYLTGLTGEEIGQTMFELVFKHLDKTLRNDPEWLFVSGYMASLWPWCCGEVVDEWEDIGRKNLIRFKKIGRELLPETFKDRGTYGWYFAHITNSGWIEQHLEPTIRGEQGTER